MSVPIMQILAEPSKRRKDIQKRKLDFFRAPACFLGEGKSFYHLEGFLSLVMNSFGLLTLKGLWQHPSPQFEKSLWLFNK